MVAVPALKQLAALGNMKLLDFLKLLAAAWRAHALGGCEAADAAVAGSRKAVLDVAAAAQVALHRLAAAIEPWA